MFTHSATVQAPLYMPGGGGEGDDALNEKLTGPWANKK